MTFGELIKQKRVNKGIGLREMAKKLNISASYYSDIEKGRRYAPDKERILEIAKILFITAKDLEELFDLAGQTKKEIPEDVISKLNQYPELIEFIRKYNNKED